MKNPLRPRRGCDVLFWQPLAGIPQKSDGARPGRKAAAGLSSRQKALPVEDGLLADNKAVMGKRLDPRRFVPFVVMHEFEALLFIDCARFSRGVGRSDLRDELQAIRDEFAPREDINDSPVTAPSKRVMQLITGYQKPLFGVLAALEIGLGGIRRQCPHFDEWLGRLESRSGA